jgi:hypothetical protein
MLCIAVMACTFGAVPTFSAPAPGIAGDWQGLLSTGSNTLHVVLHITRADDGELTGTLDSPDQGATGIALAAIAFRTPDFHFEIPRFGASYSGAANNDLSEIKGEWKQGSGSLPLAFKRIAP